MSSFRNFRNLSTFFILLSVTLYSHRINAWNLPLGNVDCSWYKTLENISSSFISKSHPKAQFFLSTKSSIKPVEVNALDWSGLKNSSFDKQKKSIVIIHGWKSSSTRKWISTITRKIHAIRDVNIILVDWTKACSSYNYFQVAEDLTDIADLILNFFNALKAEITRDGLITKDSLWNHLYFIGHSLGAHLSGQTAYLLKQSDPEFWKIERITGLDPAKPCFVNTKSEDHHRLDKSDADFVDIIHSDVGHDAHIFSFGLNQRIGHMDFFIDGGAIQPKCEDLGPLAIMRCRHKLSHEFYIQSLTTTTDNDCKMLGHYWDGNYKSALQIFEAVKNNKTCIDCPELGINAIDNTKRGGFLVLTSSLNTTCADYNDPKFVRKAIDEIQS